MTTPAEHAATVREARAILVQFIDGQALRTPELRRQALAALDALQAQAEAAEAEMERVLRELVDGVRILDVMLREPAAKGLMSAEDYRSYLSGAWLGVDEKTAAARAVLSAREEAQ